MSPAHRERPSSQPWRVVCFILAALKALTPAPADEKPPARTGVTILAHGLIAWGGNAVSVTDYWGLDSISQLLARFGSGRAWLYNPATRQFEDITAQIPDPEDAWVASSTGQQVLLFDWSAASSVRVSGLAEAAADELFAALVSIRIDGQPVLRVEPPFAHAVRPLHFIGHSRGTVVVSETVQRLGRYNVPVSCVTYLDVHDFGQPGIPSDEFFHDPAVQIWHNVDYADAAFQLNGPALPCVNPSGRPLDHFRQEPSNPLFQLQRDLTHLERFKNGCEGVVSPHAMVKDYYWGTVALDGGKHAGRPAQWYGGGDGRGLGFDRWFENGGYDHPVDSTETKLFRINAGSGAGSSNPPIPFHWDDDPSNDLGYSDNNGVPPVIFNGNFELPHLGASSGTSGSLAGWSYHGGEGTGNLVHEVGGNTYLLLDRGTSLSGTVQAVHNRFYLPSTASEIRFALRSSAPALGEHHLEVLIGNRLLRRFTVGTTPDYETRTVSLEAHRDLTGRANTLTFRMNTNPAPRAAAVVALDNISVFEGRTIPRIASFEPESDGRFLVKWQSWPPRRYQLESNRIGLQGDWTPIGPPTEQQSSGEIQIPAPPGEEPRFFRMRLFP